MIKLTTTKSHRFNRYVLIKDKNIFVDSKGGIEVDENYVTSALEVGFELVDKDAKFTSVEEAKKVKDMEDIIASAKEVANGIIHDAKMEAEQIILEAKRRANVIVQESGVEEKEEFAKTLEGRKVDELREILADEVPKEELAKMKKADLINAIIKVRYPEQ